MKNNYIHAPTVLTFVSSDDTLAQKSVLVL